MKRLRSPFIKCDTSDCAMPRMLAISRCFSFLSIIFNGLENPPEISHL